MVLFAQRWMFLASLFLFFLPLSTAASDSGEQLVLSVKVSPDSVRETRQELTDSPILQAIQHAESPVSVNEIPVSDVYLTIISSNQSTIYIMDSQGILYDEQRLLRIDLKARKKAELLRYAKELRTAHYGTFVEWEQAKHLIPKKATFKITDMETGMSFNGQRRAGSSHADVQPLTKEDSAVMKRIYGGKWSWARRSILVETGQQRLAASMHGMPHGGDGIPDNDFSGHFCIHFAGSTTHGSGKVDPDHQLMIYKAAGSVEQYLNRAAPEELITIFFVALNMQERQIVRMSFTHGLHKQIAFFLKDKESVQWVQKPGVRSPGSGSELNSSLAVEMPVDVRVVRKHRKEERMRLTFELKRSSLTEPWRIAAVGMVS